MYSMPLPMINFSPRYNEPSSLQKYSIERCNTCNKRKCICEYEIKCISCRETHVIDSDDDLRIFNDAICIVCTENTVNIILPCKHANMCSMCFDKLKKLK